MAKTTATKKVREVEDIVRHGFGADGSIAKAFRIVEVPVSEVPEGADVVPDDTPVCDWQEIQ